MNTREITLNERAWVEKAIQALELGAHPMVTLSRIARYYRSEGYKKKDIRRTIEDFILRCEPTASIVHWQPLIDSCMRSIDKVALIELESVPITQNEMKAVCALDGKMRQRLMFTLICLAKYGNMIRPKNNNWVNRNMSEIFKLANITLTSKKQAGMMSDLRAKGCLEFSKAINNVSFQIKHVSMDTKEPALLHIKDFRNLGYQLMRYLGDNKYGECQNCGKTIRKMSNRTMYCRECSEEMNRMKASERYKAITAA